MKLPQVNCPREHGEQAAEQAEQLLGAAEPLLREIRARYFMLDERPGTIARGPFAAAQHI